MSEIPKHIFDDALKYNFKSGTPNFSQQTHQFFEEVAKRTGLPMKNGAISHELLGAATETLSHLLNTKTPNPLHREILQFVEGGGGHGYIGLINHTNPSEAHLRKGEAAAKKVSRAGGWTGLAIGGVVAAHILLSGGSVKEAAASASPLPETTGHLLNGNLGAAARSGAAEGTGWVAGMAAGAALGTLAGAGPWGTVAGAVAGSVIGEKGVAYLLEQAGRAGEANEKLTAARKALISSIPSDPKAINEIKDPAARNVALAAHKALHAKNAHDRNPSDARLLTESSRADRAFQGSVSNYFTQGENARLNPAAAAEKGVAAFDKASEATPATAAASPGHSQDRPPFMIIVREARATQAQPAQSQPPQRQPANPTP